MRGIFTREERVVVIFLAASLAVGSLVLLARRVEPGIAPGSEQPPAVGDSAGARGASVVPVDVNAAGVDELTELPGIGPVRAAAIVRLREERGGFRSVDELLEVKGIGPVTLERLRPLAAAGDGVRVSGETGRSSPNTAAPGGETPE